MFSLNIELGGLPHDLLLLAVHLDLFVLNLHLNFLFLVIQKKVMGWVGGGGGSIHYNPIS